VIAKAIVDCSDLYDNAAEKLKRLDNDIDRTIQDLAEEVEARGVPKNKVARQVVSELTTRGILSPSRIYEGLGIEHKRKYRKRILEETFPRVENIPTEESSTPRAVILAASSTGHLETLENMNGRPDTKLEPEEQTKIRAPRQEDESLKDKETEYPELLKQIARLREENARLELHIEEQEKKQLAETKENLPKLFQELQQMFDSDHPGLLDARQLQKISIEAGGDLETVIPRYNIILKKAAEMGQPVPLGTYIITKPDMKLVPVRIMIDFIKKNVELSLWEKKLQGTASLT
jgi:hypothetical protein